MWELCLQQTGWPFPPGSAARLRGACWGIQVQTEQGTVNGVALGRPPSQSTRTNCILKYSEMTLLLEPCRSKTQGSFMSARGTLQLRNSIQNLAKISVSSKWPCYKCQFLKKCTIFEQKKNKPRGGGVLTHLIHHNAFKNAFFNGHFYTRKSILKNA